MMILRQTVQHTMTRTRILLTALLLASACNASAQSGPASGYEDIFRVISAKHALSTSFHALMKNMRPLCTERRQGDPDFDRKGNVQCVDRAGITDFRMSGSEDVAVSMIDATFTGNDRCAHLRSILVAQYGKPARTEGRCNSEWVVNRGKDMPLVHISLEENVRKNLVYFANQEEQGP